MSRMIHVRVDEELYGAITEKAGGNTSEYLRNLAKRDLEGKQAEEASGASPEAPKDVTNDLCVTLKFVPEWFEVVKRVARYRRLQGNGDSDELSDYINSLIAADIAEVRFEIEQRRRI